MIAIQIRNGLAAGIGAAPTFIPFTANMPDVDYIVLCTATDGFGTVGTTVTGKAVSGFYISAAVENCTVQWKAVQYAEDRIISTLSSVYGGSRGIVNVVPAGTVVPFDVPLGTADYMVQANCYDSFGDIGYNIILKRREGFTVVPIADAVFEFEVLEYGGGIDSVLSAGRLSHDWSVDAFWVEAARDFRDQIPTLRNNERFDLVDHAVQLTVGQLYGLTAPAYMTAQAVAVSGDAIDISNIRVMGGGHEVKLELLADLVTVEPAGSPSYTIAKSIAVGVAPVMFTFDVPLTGPYIIIPVCYNAANEAIGYDITERTDAGFVVTAAEDGTFDAQITQIGRHNLSTTLLTHKRFSPVTFQEYVHFNVNSAQNRQKIIYARQGRTLLLGKGSDVTSYGEPVIYYPRIPFKGIAGGQILDMSDGLIAELTLMTLKKRISERFGLQLADQSQQFTAALQSAAQQANVTWTLEEIQSKVKAIL